MVAGNMRLPQLSPSCLSGGNGCNAHGISSLTWSVAREIMLFWGARHTVTNPCCSYSLIELRETAVQGSQRSVSVSLLAKNMPLTRVEGLEKLFPMLRQFS